jgi:hypothetical protein
MQNYSTARVFYFPNSMFYLAAQALCRSNYIQLDRNEWPRDLVKTRHRSRPRQREIGITQQDKFRTPHTPVALPLPQHAFCAGGRETRQLKLA